MFDNKTDLRQFYKPCHLVNSRANVPLTSLGHNTNISLREKQKSYRVSIPNKIVCT